MGEEFDKRYRQNLINRRSTADLLEYSAVVTVAIPLSAIVGLSNYWFPWVLFAVYLTIRDVPAKGSWGKLLVGLELANSKGVDVTPAARVIRNTPFMVPIMPIIEFLVAYFGSDPQNEAAWGQDRRYQDRRRRA